ncbi:Hypothetical predicted protein [Podarcis lilfordi]|uniref:Uncharacterized protein n=1 Tax=Podarcis lilfordi TaxID=74358 RepID=A0AA35KLE3_9SAUR|nr:Hypothetical predicted protein [Podarcis lilfordi]
MTQLCKTVSYEEATETQSLRDGGSVGDWDSNLLLMRLHSPCRSRKHQLPPCISKLESLVDSLASVQQRLAKC